MGGVAKYHSAEKYVFLLLLFTAAVIPVNQVFTLLMVAVTFFAGGGNFFCRAGGGR